MPRSSGPFITGKVGFVSVVNTAGQAPTVSLPATNISISAKAEVPDITSVSSGGYMETVIGTRSAEITLDVSYDPDRFAGFYVGQKVDVRVVPTGNNPATPPAEYPASALAFLFDSATISSINYTVAVKDAQKVSLSIKSCGAYAFMG